MTFRRHETFSLYHLSANEIYFEDYIVHYENPSHDDQQNRIKGRLKICSKSLVFVPSDTRTSMIKIPYREIEGFEDSRHNELSLTAATILSSPTSSVSPRSKSNGIIIISRSLIYMGALGHIKPYRIEHERRRIHFELLYTKVEDCLWVVGQLYRSSTLPFPEQMMMIESIVQGRLKILKFDLKELTGPNKRIIFEHEAYVIKPLIKNPGRCLLTEQYCYFQALNNIDEQQISKYDLSTLDKLTKRRYKFQNIGCELHFKFIEKEKKRKKILYLVFANEQICSEFYDLVSSQPSVKLDRTALEHMTLRWQQGQISNYDYLLYLNDCGERSFRDCSQYPVFPWVLRNYTTETLDLNDPQSFRDLSKPIGALNIDRLERLKERYTNMCLPSDHQRFLYGSFYSNPGFIVYFLCRIYPELCLCLNGGRYDQPDRLFHSILDTWTSVLNSDSDVKELLPEFYMSSHWEENKLDYEDEDEDLRRDGQFLMNKYKIDFGVRHDNVRVADVLLPPWAKDERDFVHKMRAALESDHVSQHLHQWIDLIFGYKQRGEEARKADNLFHHLTYGVPDNHISQSTEEFDQQLSLETQILEFGQVPKQLFTHPHPRKLTEQEIKDYEAQEQNKPREVPSALPKAPEETDSSDIPSARPPMQSAAAASFDEQELGHFEFDSRFRLHKTAIRRILPHPSCPSTHLLTIGDDGFLRNYSVDQPTAERFICVSSSPLTCFQALSVHLTAASDERCSLAAIGSRDGRFYIYNLESGTSMFSQALHDDAITELYVTNLSSPVILCTASSDATVRFWSLEPLLTMIDEKHVLQPNAYLVNRIHSHDPISLDSPCPCTAMNVLEEHSIFAVGCEDGSIHLCHFQSGNVLRQFSSTRPILSLAIRSDGLYLGYLTSKTFTLVDIETTTEMFNTTCPTDDQTFTCLFYSSKMFLLGLNTGSCDIWNSKICEKVLSLNVCDHLPINTITYNDGMFFFGTNDGSVHSYVFASRHPLAN